jgi:hypothetical protein
MKFVWNPEKAKSSETNNQEDDLLPEYDFDYRKARPNRFALKDDQRVVILEPDVAEIFKTSESVNEVLRALIATMPKAEP